MWTDHKNLEYIRTAKILNSRQARLSLFVTRFNCTLSYLAGSRNVEPDALSRHYQSGEETSPESSSILPAQCLVAVVSWEIEERVRAALEDQSGPSGPPGGLVDVLKWAHDSRLSCHPGIQTRKVFVQQCFWWAALHAVTRGFR